MWWLLGQAKWQDPLPSQFFNFCPFSWHNLLNANNFLSSALILHWTEYRSLLVSHWNDSSSAAWPHCVVQKASECNYQINCLVNIIFLATISYWVWRALRSKTWILLNFIDLQPDPTLMQTFDLSLSVSFCGCLQMLLIKEINSFLLLRQDNCSNGSAAIEWDVLKQWVTWKENQHEKQLGDLCWSQHHDSGFCDLCFTTHLIDNVLHPDWTALVLNQSVPWSRLEGGRCTWDLKPQSINLRIFIVHLSLWF